MKTKIWFIFVFIIANRICAQTNDSITSPINYTGTELLVGKTFDSNVNFPKTNFHKSIFLNFGKKSDNTQEEWAYRLGFPNTGMSFGLTNYGNPKKLGYAFTVMPFSEFNLQKKHRNLKLLVGLGTTYLTKKYDSIPYIYNNYPEEVNRANRTRLNWSFRLFFTYSIAQKDVSNWKVGLGYFHQSNGHTKLPNQGFNSILLSVTKETFYNTPNQNKTKVKNIPFLKSSYWFLNFQSGVGQNVLSEYLNSRKPVYNFQITTGKVFNNTLKLGLGGYYRVYGCYYDYIKNEGELILTDYPEMLENPTKNASAYGVFASSELLLGHIGFGVTLGYNIYKPFYEAQWRLAEGFNWQTQSGNIVWIEGELDKSYKLKSKIYSKLGLAYYLKNNNTAPEHNFFIGAYLHANLGQADFSELSIGYVYRFKKKYSSKKQG